jgi:hypothetical protein
MCCKGFAQGCKSRLCKRFSLLWLALCCTVLRSRWYQSGIKFVLPSTLYGRRHEASEIWNSAFLSSIQTGGQPGEDYDCANPNPQVPQDEQLPQTHQFHELVEEVASVEVGGHEAANLAALKLQVLKPP